MTRRLSVTDVRRAVETAYAIPAEEMLGLSRKQPLALRRQMAMALAREFTGASFPRIGQIFQCTHKTALNACRAVSALEAGAPAFKREMDRLRHLFACGTQQEQTLPANEIGEHCTSEGQNPAKQFNSALGRPA